MKNRLYKFLTGRIFTPCSYIEYDNLNSMWNSGWIYVYIEGKLVESIYVDDFLDSQQNGLLDSPRCIIDMLKEKYGISKEIIKSHDWR